jgi:hypothetical protein
MINEQTITQKEKSYVASLVSSYLYFTIKIFLFMPLICAIGVPALWVMQALFSALGFSSLLFIPAAYLAIRLINKIQRLSYQIAIYIGVLVAGYGALLYFKLLNSDVFKVMAGITVFCAVIFFPFLIYYFSQYRKISRGDFALERRSAQGNVSIYWQNRKPIVRIGNYLLSDLIVYKKKDAALYNRIISILTQGGEVAAELALGKNGYMKHKNLLLKIDDWSIAD